MARTRWLAVAASISVENLPPKTGLREAAEKLGVRYVVTGDLRRERDALAVSYSLVDAGTGRIIIADNISSQGSHMTVLMQDICEPVVAAVETEIERIEQQRALLSPVRRIDAWMGLHRGMGQLRRQDTATLGDTRLVLNDAARADPACARIAAARSWLFWQEIFLGQASNRDRTLALARDFAPESTALDARDPLGHWAMGRMEWLAGDMQAAAANLERSVFLNPSFASDHYSLGISLQMLGRETAALRKCDVAIRLSPLDPMAFAFHCLKCQLLYFGGEIEGAMENARLAADHPNFHAYGVALAAWVFELCGNRKAALDRMARLSRRWPDYSREKYVSALFHRNRFPEGRRRMIGSALNRLGF